MEMPQTHQAIRPASTFYSTSATHHPLPPKLSHAIGVTLSAQNLPLSKLLDYITEQTRTQWKVDGVSVLVGPIGSLNEGLIFRTFRVPPNFLQAATASSDQLSDDPFGSDDGEEGKLPARANITDFLKQNGISFPEGASASYSAPDNTLMVRNSPENIDPDGTTRHP